MLFRVIVGAIFLLVGSSVATALEPDKVFAKVSKSIVMVGAQGASPDEVALGSGVVIAPGEIITNCHVVENAQQIAVARESFRSLAVLRFSDRERDLCQLRVIDSTGFTQAVRETVDFDALRVGQKVYAIGAPQGLDLTLSDGLISSIRYTDFGNFIQTTAPVSQGSSGGGLFDSNGKLVGIITFLIEGGQNLNFAVPADWIAELPYRVTDLVKREQNRLAEERRLEEEERKRQAVIEEEQKRQRIAAQEQLKRERELAEKERQAYLAEEQRRKEAQLRAERERVRLENTRRAAEEEEKRQLEEAREKLSRDYEDGLRAFNRRDYATALTKYEKAARQGHVTAQYYLGLMFYNGNGVGRDLDLAAYWYGKAALQGNKLAQVALDELRKRRAEARQEKRERIEEARRLAEKKRLEEEQLRRKLAKTQRQAEMARALERLRVAEEQCQYEVESCRREVERARADVEQRRRAEEERQRQGAIRLEAQLREEEAEERHRAEQLRAEEEERQRVAEQERQQREREVAEQKRQAERVRRSKIEAERQAKQQAAAAARAAEQQLVDDYKVRISAKVRSRVLMPPDISGNPEALYEVVLLPGGDVLSVKLKKSSGVPAYDTAVEKAIWAAQPLPVPSADLFQDNFRRFTMSFHPKE